MEQMKEWGYMVEFGLFEDKGLISTSVVPRRGVSNSVKLTLSSTTVKRRHFKNSANETFFFKKGQLNRSAKDTSQQEAQTTQLCMQ